MSGESEIIYPADKNVAVVGGEVVPVGSSRMTPSEILVQIRTVVALPYMGNEPDKIGMTLMEAALYAAAKKAADGDVDALNKLLDRLVGKPVQQVVQATGTLREFLDMIAREEVVETTARPAAPAATLEDL